MEKKIVEKNNFHWGVSSAALQTEGAWNIDGKGPNIWDEFALKKKIKGRENHFIATDFYHRYEEDLNLMASLGIKNFRFSISWSRIFPDGIGKINPLGLTFYHKLIDACLSRNITPWITLYHWDLPLILEKKGGWTNRFILDWFSTYTTTCLKEYGDRVKNWMVLNEPVVFTGAGYFLGVHAPGKRGIKNFLQATHNASLVQGLMPDLMRSIQKGLFIGTTFSCSMITESNPSEKHQMAGQRADALLNRLFAQPLSGKGYPITELSALQRLELLIHQNDEKNLVGEYDFIGVQNYTREVVSHAWYIPYLKAKLVAADKRGVPHTQMNWEVYPPSIYHSLRQFSQIFPDKPLIVTENGAAFKDQIINDQIKDDHRKEYLKAYIQQVQKAKEDGINVQGYFVWSFTDNFEWAEGYKPRFGLVHVDYSSQKRTIKDSGFWYSDFIINQKSHQTL